MVMGFAAVLKVFVKQIAGVEKVMTQTFLHHLPRKTAKADKSNKNKQH